MLFSMWAILCLLQSLSAVASRSQGFSDDAKLYVSFKIICTWLCLLQSLSAVANRSQALVTMPGFICSLEVCALLCAFQKAYVPPGRPLHYFRAIFASPCKRAIQPLKLPWLHYFPDTLHLQDVAQVVSRHAAVQSCKLRSMQLLMLPRLHHCPNALYLQVLQNWCHKSLLDRQKFYTFSHTAQMYKATDLDRASYRADL